MLAHEEVSRIAEDETMQFCKAEQIIQQSKGTIGRTYDDVSLHARATHCGLATAFIQHYLKQNQGITSERLFGEPPLAPRTEMHRKFGHVIVAVDQFLVDPTYGQLFSYVGVPLPHLATEHDFTYPDHLSLVIDANDPERALEPFIDTLKATNMPDAQYAPLRGMSRAAIADVVYDIYNPANYQSYELESMHPMYDYVQALKQASDQIRQK